MKKVMVAIDKREEAVGLATVAAALASQGAMVDVLHVHDLGSRQSFAEADATTTEAVDLLRSRGAQVRGHVVSADDGVAKSLVVQARRLGSELVVMGSRGLGRAGNLGGRSVSHAVLADLDVPVLVLSDHARLPLHGLRRALVAVGSEDDAGPVVEAVGLLPHLGQVVVAHVPRRVAVHVGERAGETFAEIGETSSVVLAGAIARFQTAGIRAAACTAERDGGVAAALARIANDQDADVIVLGARRPGGWESLVAGSTLHEVLRLGDRPVLVAGRRQHVASATGT